MGTISNPQPDKIWKPQPLQNALQAAQPFRSAEKFMLERKVLVI